MAKVPFCVRHSMSAILGQMYRNIANAFKAQIESLYSSLDECHARLAIITAEMISLAKPFGLDKPFTDEAKERFKELREKGEPLDQKRKALEKAIEALEEQYRIFDSLASQYGG